MCEKEHFTAGKTVHSNSTTKLFLTLIKSFIVVKFAVYYVISAELMYFMNCISAFKGFSGFYNETIIVVFIS